MKILLFKENTIKVALNAISFLNLRLKTLGKMVYNTSSSTTTNNITIDAMSVSKFFKSKLIFFKKRFQIIPNFQI